MAGHTLQALGTASLDSMLGLVTLADSQDLPEGASPLCWDVDFNVGAVLTRPGLQSVFSYENSFDGPNLGEVALVVGGGNVWTNPNGALGNVTFASVKTQANLTVSGTPATIIDIVGGIAWTNPTHVVNLSAPGATVVINNPNATPLQSDFIVASHTGIAIPSNAVIAGVAVQLIAKYTDNIGSPIGQITDLSLATGNTAIGTPFSKNLTTAYAPYGFGNSSYLWGAVLTPAIINNSNFGVKFAASCPTTGEVTVSAYSLKLSVYYSTNNGSDDLQVKTFTLVIPSTGLMTGFTVSALAESSAETSLHVQLMKAGVAVGTPKIQVLTTSSHTYTLGSAVDLWGATWLFSDVENTDFGVQITASGAGTSFVRNVQIEAFFTPGASNFNYIKTYEQDDDQIFTLALDATGILWAEDVTHNPGELFVGLTGILPGSFARSATANDQEYVLFSNLISGTDRPRVVSENIGGTGLQYLPLSQVGPGAPPSVQGAGAVNSTIDITAYSLTGNVVTFTYSNPTAEPSAGQLVKINGVVGYLNGQILSVSATGLSSTQFQAVFQHADDPGSSVTGTATSPFTTKIVSITQPPPNPVGMNGGSGSNGFDWQAVVQSVGPGTSTTAGNIIAVYYGPKANASPDPMFSAMFAAGLPIYVQITGSQFADGIWQVIEHNTATPPGDSNSWWYFSFQVSGSAYQNVGASGHGGGAAGQYQVTQATMTVSEPLLGVTNGSSIQITGASAGNWNNTWTIEASNSFVLAVVSTALADTGVATIDFTISSGTGVVAAGQTIAITGTTNGNGVFNTTGTIATTNGTTTLTMNIGVPQNVPSAPDTGGQAVVSGTVFNFDPAANLAPTTEVSPGAIFPYTPNSGSITVVGGAIQPITAGIRQAVVFFITESGYETSPSPPVTFTVNQATNYLLFSQIPLGPPNVIARGIAITEAGQNGVPGANFYVIRTPFSFTVNGQPVTYFPTIINDNVSTTASFNFSDSVLLSSDEIDVQGNDLFNLIELGSAAWGVPYVSRMFYGLSLNKLDNFLNMTFDGGYLPSTNPQPLGWVAGNNPGGGTPVAITAFSITSNVVTIHANNAYTPGQSISIVGMTHATYLNGGDYVVLSSGLSPTQFQFTFVHANVGLTTDTTGTATSINVGSKLILSPVEGQALYIKDTIEGVTAQMGFYSQSAYQDAYGVAIIESNTEYSIRVAASNPSGVKVGTLVLELVEYNQGTGFSTVFGQFQVPLSSMTTNMSVFTGALLTIPFTTNYPGNTPPGAVPQGLRFAFYVKQMGLGSDVLIDRIEVYPTQQPYYKSQVFGSYITKLEAIDASATGGVIDTSTENQQACMGGLIMHDNLYLLKTSSTYLVQDNPASEPGGWGLKEVSKTVGTIGINSYDYGEEWFVTACRQGIFGCVGSQPIKIMQEIYQIWDAINWFAGRTIVLRNDIKQRRMLCAVPLPTPNKWLPNAPLNLAPETPNVMLALNYQGLNTFEELVTSAEMHTTMFGTLAAVDMKRKWTIWQIPSPYMDFITQRDTTTQVLDICNGINSSKIYQLSTTQRSDDGVAINGLYTTYGFVNAAKAVTMPIFGMHAKRYTWLQLNVQGSGTLQVKAYPNTLQAKYPWTIPGPIDPESGLHTSFVLSPTMQDDVGRSLNTKGNRVFLEFQTNAVGDYFELHKILLSGKADAWAPINPTGGGNQGT